MYRGLIRGFLAGVFLTLLVLGVGGYFFYQGLQEKLSPEEVRKASEAALDRLLGQRTHVGSAKVSPSGLLVLDRVRIQSSTRTLLAVERIEAQSDGGLKGLQEGRFARIVVKNPVIALERIEGKWNILELAAPIVQRFATHPDSDEEETVKGQLSTGGLELSRVEVTGLQLTVTLKETETYSGVEIGNIVLRRDEEKSVWNLEVENGRFRLNPTADEWPLVEAYEAAAALFPGLASGTPPTGTPGVNSRAGGFEIRLETVNLRNLEMELLHPQQRLTVEGISLAAEDFFKLIRIQSGGGEKKNVHRDV